MLNNCQITKLKVQKVKGYDLIKRQALFLFPNKTQIGFTLTEIMVALILTGIMMTGGLFIYLHFMDSWDKEGLLLEVQRQGTYTLKVIEKAIRSGVKCMPGEFENNKYHKITVTVLVEDPSTGVVMTKDKEYFLDQTINPKAIKEKDTQSLAETSLCPDTYFKEGSIRSDVSVESLSFTPDSLDESGNAKGSITVDLRLKRPRIRADDQGEIVVFTCTAGLRNQKVNEE